MFQLVCLGPDLYNGASGIALFLAAHAAVTADAASAELAHAGLAHIRKNLKSRNAPRLARSLGIGAATGLGSIVYAFAVIAKCLGEVGILEDAERAARLFTDELIAADKQLDVMGGAAGGILALLRLYRDTQSDEALTRAIRCGEHLLARDRVGVIGRRSWVGQDLAAPRLTVCRTVLRDLLMRFHRWRRRAAAKNSRLRRPSAWHLRMPATTPSAATGLTCA